jgi:Kef-type K+ transport system membrane component KefB
MWIWCGLIVLVAIAGKLGGCLVAGPVHRHALPKAACLGALMDARGLMALVILNIGLDLGVILALVTTLMTSPLVDVILRRVSDAGAQPIHDRRFYVTSLEK